ncbi:hypothetical protein [Syntrophobacter fumaroxidans]|nr:hypothetical protein [Syntrophobacter fumaroxidans]
MNENTCSAKDFEAVFMKKGSPARSRALEGQGHPSGVGFPNREIGQLNDAAGRSVYAESFGKYLRTEKEEPKFSREEREKREKARRANEIYRRACSDTGLKKCFFSDFGDWSDFVTGKISEAEFVERTETTARAMALENN